VQDAATSTTRDGAADAESSDTCFLSGEPAEKGGHGGSPLFHASILAASQAGSSTTSSSISIDHRAAAATAATHAIERWSPDDHTAIEQEQYDAYMRG
jgi:hypothetical protein